VPDAAAQDPVASHARKPADVYRSSCQGCHGPDGRGVPQSTTALPLPVPDFADCNFAAREPDSDWLAIIHDGGPARGFDPLMPAFGEALSMADMEAALAHVRTFCADRQAWPSGNLNLPRTLFTEKAFVEDEVVVTAAIAAEGDPSIASKVVYEKRFFSKGQFELVVPLGFKKPDGHDWTTGLGDVVLGWKQVLLHTAGAARSWRPRARSSCPLATRVEVSARASPSSSRSCRSARCCGATRSSRRRRASSCRPTRP
jgi:hypothetical protein